MNFLLHAISQSTEQFKKMKQIKIRDDFFDRDLEAMRQTKNQLYGVARIANPSESTAKWDEYRLFKNNYKKEIRAKKYEKNQKKLSEANGDMKRTWKVLNSILNKDCCEITYIKDGENEYEEDTIIAEKFNEYFVNSIIELNRNIPNAPPEHSTDIIGLPANTNPPFRFKPVSITEVKSTIKELKNNTDEFFLKADVLSDAVFIIGQQLTSVINDSLSTGIFPKALKRSTIVPVQKKNGTVLINEHRPINILPCVEKLIEKIVHRQIMEYIDANKLLLIKKIPIGFS